MWTSDPYWQEPEEEGPRTARIKSGLREYVKKPGDVLFIVIKSWNDNCVIYEYDPDGEQAVKASWLSLEPDEKERHIKMGNPSLRSQLNPAEDMLFGCSVKVVEGDRFLVRINQEQLSNRTFELVMDSSGNPAVIGAINGIMCRVEHAYVQMKKGSIPDAEYMNFYGRSLKDGSTVVEKIVGM